jgi:hypothetical protein
MESSNIANLIILLLLPLICIIILVPIMFIISKLFSLLIARFELHEIKRVKLHEIKSIHIAGSIGSIIFFLLLIGMFLLHNYEHQKPLFYFSSWQILSIVILFTIIGSEVSHEYKNKFLKQILPAPAALILLSVIVALWGVDVIKAKEAYVNHIHFRSGEAIYIGIVYIVWAILLFILAAYLYIKRNKKS